MENALQIRWLYICQSSLTYRRIGHKVVCGSYQFIQRVFTDIKPRCCNNAVVCSALLSVNQSVVVQNVCGPSSVSTFHEPVISRVAASGKHIKVASVTDFKVGNLVKENEIEILRKAKHLSSKKIC